MSKIVNLDDFKKEKNQQGLPLSNEGCFIAMNGVRLDMGGAFVQDMVVFIQEYRPELVNLMNEVCEIQVNVINDVITNDTDTSVSEQEKETYKELLIDGTKSITKDFIQLITDVDSIRDFFNIFEDDSKHRSLASTFVVMLVGLRFDSLSLQRMVKNQWIEVQPSVDAFTKLEVYTNYSAIRQSINEEQN